MKFWIIENVGETMGCYLTKREALQQGKACGVPAENMRVFWVDVDVTAENIRRLLGQHGGYAKAQGGE